MKAFEKHQTELNYLILDTLAHYEGKAIRSMAIKQVIDNTYPIEYLPVEISNRLRALENRGIVKKVFAKDSGIRIDKYPFGFWFLTDRGKEAYAKRDWAISGK